MLSLLLTGAAAAQPQPPERERQERRIPLPIGPDEPVPEVHTANGETTVVRFDAPLDAATLELDGHATRFHLVDVGVYTVVLEPSVEPGPGERLGLRVRYRDGTSPRYATLALVSHPTRVDKEVEVVRRPRTIEALEAELVALRARSAANSPSSFILSGLVDEKGVRVVPFDGKALPGNKSGLTPVGGRIYRATRWAVVSLGVRNEGNKSWAPGEVRLTSAAGHTLEVRAVRMDRPVLAPGEVGTLMVEVKPLSDGEAPLRLELLDTEGGRLLPIHGVTF